MMLWIVFAVLTIGTLLLLAVPLLKRPVPPSARVDYDMVVYRDQLAELDRDTARGLLTEDQAAAARTEIHRRMLAAEDAELSLPRLPTGSAVARWRHWPLLAAILVGVPLLAVGLYLHLGSPGLPDQPFAARQSDPEFKLAAMAEHLAANLRQRPDAEGYSTLAETFLALRRYPEAVEAFRQAINLGERNARLLATYAEAVVLSSDGMVVPEARRAFLQALALDGSDPRARFYLGLAKAQIGEYAGAVAIWRDLEEGSPAGAPWLAMLREHIDQFARLGGFDPKSIAPAPPTVPSAPSAQASPPPGSAQASQPPGPAPSAPPSGPAQAAIPDAAAVETQSPEEQSKTIHAMVDRLAARLKDNPDDVEGWMRLARSYRVLGDLDKAKDAAQRAVALRPGEVEPKLSLAQIQLATAKDDSLPDDFVATMREVLAMDSTNPMALYYVGAAEASAGHVPKARELWSQLLAALPAEAPERADIARQLEALPKN